MMKYYYVYILICADNSYYVGITNDFERRIIEHNNGSSRKSYTYSRRPVKLLYQDYFTEIHEAIAFEKQIKGWSRAKKEALIKGDWDEIVRLAKRKTK